MVPFCSGPHLVPSHVHGSVRLIFGTSASDSSGGTEPRGAQRVCHVFGNVRGVPEVPLEQGSSLGAALDGPEESPGTPPQTDASYGYSAQNPPPLGKYLQRKVSRRKGVPIPLMWKLRLRGAKEQALFERVPDSIQGCRSLLRILPSP